MRKFNGVRAKQAMEFAQFTGNLRSFKLLIDDGSEVSDDAAAERDKEPSLQRTYSAREIRRARLRMANLPDDLERVPKTLPPIINCRMSKGGTGKTTVASNVAVTLALMGHRVLVIDADPDASLTTLFGVDWTQEDITHVGELMRCTAKGIETDVQGAFRSIYPNGMLDLLASDITLVDTDSWLMATPNREAAFRRMLETNLDVFGCYDVIVVDSAPGTTLLTNSIMFASKTIVAVVMLNGKSLRAMDVLARNIHELNAAYADRNLNLGVHIVANGWHASYGTCRESLQVLSNSYGELVDDNVIPYAAGFMRETSFYNDGDSGPILEREPNSLGARAMIDLTKSLIRRFGIQLPRDAGGDEESGHGDAHESAGAASKPAKPATHF